MFAYTLEHTPKNGNWSRYERPEPYNPIIDDVVASLHLSSSLYPSGNNPLERVHSFAARWYKRAVEEHETYSISRRYVWRNDAWQLKQ